MRQELNDALKAAMKAKDTVTLESLRAIKSALLLAKTDKGGGAALSEADEISLVQKLVKQRKDSAAIYHQQGREDLAGPELAQVAVLERFLPAQLSEAEVEKAVAAIVAKLGASGMQDMGRVMGMATKELAGAADGKAISAVVRRLLSQ